MDGEKFQRLAHIAKPLHYALHIKPDLTQFVFDGEETIEIEVLQEATQLQLYSKSIDIKHIDVLGGGGQDFKNIKFDYDKRWERVTLIFPSALPKGTAKLMLKFHGVINDKMRGFYRSKYTDANGKDAWIAVTHFEAAKAREAFPCFDEPAFKATFDVSLTVPQEKTALSCMKVIDESKNADGTKTVRFARTPLMSSYLVAYAVGDLDYVEDTTKSGIRVRVYAVVGKSALGKFALEVATKALPFYTDYFNVPYALDKCDLIALPDFEMGAMENWGLVTFRELILLFDPAQTSPMIKQRCAEVVGHELAHMWFGNLVTMDWWTDLWLKEGFATYMAFFFTSKTYPEFDIWNQFVQGETLASMTLDALRSSHPIEVPINDPEELEEIYDQISYDKSASIIRMIAAYLGEDTFRQGLQAYLKRFQFKNAETKDLWTELGKASKQDVAAMVHNFTSKMGFPVVKVDRRDENGKTVLHLEQSRFFADGSDDPSGVIWQIPITLSIGKDPNAIHWRDILKEKSKEVVLADVGPNEWIKLNTGFSGYYRVQYSPEMLKAIADALAAGKLSTVDRFNLCADVFALLVAGKASAESALSLLDTYRSETDNNVWANIADGVGILANVMAETEYAQAFDAYIRWLFSKIYEKLGFDAKPGESHGDLLLRPLVLSRLGRAGDEKVLAEAKRRFDAYVAHFDKTGTTDPALAPDIRSVVFSLAAQAGGEATMKQLLHLYEKTDVSEVKRNCLTAIGRCTDTKLQLQALQFSLTDKVRIQDIVAVTFGVTGGASHTAKHTAWEFLKANFDKYGERFGSVSSHLLIYVIKFCTEDHCSDKMADEISGFFAKYVGEAPAIRRPVEQSVEHVRNNAATLRRYGKTIGEWLHARKFDDAAKQKQEL